MIEPFNTGLLEVDGHRLYWEECGNPDGKPAIVLHGGPGSGCSPWMRRVFDPSVYRVVLFDQRGAGRSTPHASEPDVDLHSNTTDHLIADIELLRHLLGIDQWLLFGVSWGSTLAVAYAEQHPDRVSAAVLAPVTLTRPTDVEWFTRGAGRFFPEQWRTFVDSVPEPDRDGNLAAAYTALLTDPDPAVQRAAALAWCAWEEALVSVESGGVPNPRYDNPRFRLGFARLVTHYFAHGAWREEDQLLDQAHRLADIPGVLVHGQLDVGGPLLAAWQLQRAWPGSRLIVVTGAGHTSVGIRGTATAALSELAAGHQLYPGREIS